MRIVLVMLVVAACGKGSGDQASKRGAAAPTNVPDPKGELARLAVMNYAESAYPMWASQHADKACPDKITDLDEFMNGREQVDPWGHAFRMQCGGTLPAGAKGIAISSDGPDGVPDTADDVRSWAP